MFRNFKVHAKIRKELLLEILDKCISSEISFLLYLSQFQDEDSFVRDIHYTEMCSALKCTPATFYKILYSLEKKGFIDIMPYNNVYWTIRIKNNAFNHDDKDYKGQVYLNTNRDMLHSIEFVKCSKNIKVLILRLLLTNTENQYFKISVGKLMKEWLNIKSKKLIKKYIGIMNQWFEIILNKRGVLYFKQKVLSKKSVFTIARNTQREKFWDRKFRTFCAQYKIKCTDDNLNELITMIAQYMPPEDEGDDNYIEKARKFSRMIAGLFKTVFAREDNFGEPIKDRIIESKYINFYINLEGTV